MSCNYVKKGIFLTLELRGGLNLLETRLVNSNFLVYIELIVDVMIQVIGFIKVHFITPGKEDL